MADFMFTDTMPFPDAAAWREIAETLRTDTFDIVRIPHARIEAGDEWRGRSLQDVVHDIPYSIHDAQVPAEVAHIIEACVDAHDNGSDARGLVPPRD